MTLDRSPEFLLKTSNLYVSINKKNAKRHYSGVLDTYLIRIIMSNMEERVLIQIF